MNKLVLSSILTIGFFVVLWETRPKGIRNNNPLNIRHNPNNNWLGQVGVDKDGFVVFSEAFYGFRASAKILDSYRKRGVDTIEKIISRWSPPVGVDVNGNTYSNPTRSYINGVSEKTGISENAIINRNDYPILMLAMVKHENGVNQYDVNYIRFGVDYDRTS